MNAHQPISQIEVHAAITEEASDTRVSAAFLSGDHSGAIASSGQDEVNAGSGSLPTDCANAMHELANSVTALLLNTQVLEWKLPPYSRLKGLVREIERHAQRSGTLLKCLLGRCETDPFQHQGGKLSPSHGATLAREAQGPAARHAGPVKLPPVAPSPAVPGLGFPPERELTSLCDRCTSIPFPKEER